jgi:hypothetical protein
MLSLPGQAGRLGPQILRHPAVLLKMGQVLGGKRLEVRVVAAPGIALEHGDRILVRGALHIVVLSIVLSAGRRVALVVLVEMNALSSADVSVWSLIILAANVLLAASARSSASLLDSISNKSPVAALVTKSCVDGLTPRTELTPVFSPRL